MADVEERRPADAYQAERIPVGEDALLDSEEGPRIALLVAQRVAAQAAVAAEEELLARVERVGGAAAEPT